MAAKGAEGQTSIYSLYFHIIFKKDGSAREKNLVLHQNGTMEYSFHQLIGNLVTPIIYLFKESQESWISRRIYDLLPKKTHLPLSGSRVNRAAGAEGVFSPCRTVVETAAMSWCRKTT